MQTKKCVLKLFTWTQAQTCDPGFYGLPPAGTAIP